MMDQINHTDESSKKFLDSLRDAVIVTDRAGVITFLNHGALQMMNFVRESTLGQPLHHKIIIQNEQGETADVQKLLLIPTLQEKRSLVLDGKSGGRLLLARSDRSQFPAAFQTLPFPMMGEGDGMTLVIYDISDDEKIEKSKSEFVSLVSHQLRTPVNITTWYTEKLMSQKKGQLNEKQMEYLGEISASNQRIIDLVSAIVNVSRTDLDRLKSKLEDVELVAVIDEAVRGYGELAKARQVSVSKTFSVPEVRLQESDREYIEVILRTIINNAIKYNRPDGTVEISISQVGTDVEIDPKTSFTTTKPGVVISVKDNGLGIPDHQKDGVFTKLFRADNVQALDVTGLGLGLYIARSFVEALYGHIWFDSRLREGSTFHLYLPTND